LFHAAAQDFVESARAALARQPFFAVALAGGSTPQGLYETLATSPYRDDVEWSRVQWFWGDERPVGPDHAESNYRMAYEALLSRIDVDPASVHRLRGEATALADAATEYEGTLATVFNATLDGPPPRLDYVLLGMGSDGHTASLFPQTAALDVNDRWIVANDVPQLGTSRLTMTYRLLNAAAAVSFLVTGESKAHVLHNVLHGPHDPHRLPSQAIRPTAGRLIWYVDRAAAARLG